MHSYDPYSNMLKPPTGHTTVSITCLKWDIKAWKAMVIVVTSKVERLRGPLIQVHEAEHKS
jgi:hypothetical protein